MEYESSLKNKYSEKEIAMTEVALKIINCMECQYHEVRPDPDPDDWFNDDDVKVVCMKANKNVTVACRPYNIWKESDTPSWCPLKH